MEGGDRGRPQEQDAQESDADLRRSITVRPPSISQYPAREDTCGAREEHDRPVGERHEERIHPEAAHQVRGEPESDAVEEQRETSDPKEKVQVEPFVYEQVCDHRTDTRQLCGDALPRRLLHRHHPQRDEDARRAEQQEGDLPAADLADERQIERWQDGYVLHERAREHDGDADAEVHPHRKEPERSTALLGWKIVGEHRISGGRQRRFTHADPHACGEKPGEARHAATDGGQQRPEKDAARDDVAAIAFIRPGADGPDAKEGVEEREREAVQQADLGVGETEVRLDRSDQHREDLTIDVGEQVRHHQDDDGVPCLGSGRPVASRHRQ